LTGHGAIPIVFVHAVLGSLRVPEILGGLMANGASMFGRYRLALMFWLLAPAALRRRLRRRPSGWVPASPER
jgi:hypothetical protein